MTNTEYVLTQSLRADILEAIVEEARTFDDTDGLSDGDILAADDYWGPVYDVIAEFPVGLVVPTDEDIAALDAGVEDGLSPAGIVILTVTHFIGHWPGHPGV